MSPMGGGPRWVPGDAGQMPDRSGLDAGNHASWEAKVDHRLDYQYERTVSLRQTDHDLYAKIGAAEGRSQRMQSALTVAEQSIERLRLAIYLLIVMVLTVAVVAVVAVIQ